MKTKTTKELKKLKDLMVAHGKTGHPFGKPCKVCEKIFADNPYVKSLLAKKESEVKEKLRGEIEGMKKHLKKEFCETCNTTPCRNFCEDCGYPRDNCQCDHNQAIDDILELIK